MTSPETWLLGPLDGFSNTLMPVAHSLTQAKRELATLQAVLTDKLCTTKPGEAASIGFHLAHIDGSLDRLFCYARGDQLNSSQLWFLHQEAQFGTERTKEELLTNALERIDRSLEELRRIPDSCLYDTRKVGRKELPATVLGLAFHAAEHATMHIAQIRTTLKLIEKGDTSS